MTSEQHNRYVSWAFLGHGAFQILMGLLMMAFMSMVLFIPDDGRGGSPPPPAFFGVVALFVFVFQGIFAVPSFIAAYGLRKKKRWARIASIVAGVISAMNVPIGTAACVYAMWFFLGENWKEVYPEVAFEKQNKAAALQLAHERETRWSGYQTDEKGEPTFNPIDPPDWR